MLVAILSTFAANRREPLAEMLTRVRAGFVDGGPGEPAIQFSFGDPLIPGFVSSVDRVLRRYPDLRRFETAAQPMPGIAGARRLSNAASSPAAGEVLPWDQLIAIATGVPRSFPFHSVSIHFGSVVFGAPGPAAVRSAELMPGILVSDAWWVNGRIRALSACRVADVEPAAKRLPSPTDAVAAVFAACGKVTRTIQAPLPDLAATSQGVAIRGPDGSLGASARPEAARAVAPIVADYRARMGELVVRASLPHDLPALPDAPFAGSDVSHGPLKPALDHVLGPLGYTGKGGSGTFTYRRRTESNLTVEVSIDAGTWSHSAVAILKVFGIGFKGTLMLPFSAGQTVGAQFPIGDAGRWSKMIENMGALVALLDQTFVPEIERAVGPSPVWYVPDR